MTGPRVARLTCEDVMPMPRKAIDPHYLDGSTDVPLFRMPKDTANRGTEKRKKAPTAAHGLCPMHVNGDKRTGLVYAGEHLVWIVHFKRIGNASIQCQSSGVAICECQPTDGQMRIVMKPGQDKADNGMRDAKCPHTIKSDRLVRMKEIHDKQMADAEVLREEDAKRLAAQREREAAMQADPFGSD